MHEAGARMEEDLRELVRYLNDEVVPEVRRSGSEALRVAARELNRMAERMDQRADSHSAHTPPPAGDGGAPRS